MTFDRVRVISKGNKYSIEFIFFKPNLLIKLIYKKNLSSSIIDDGKLAYIPNDEQDFINCLSKLAINKELNDYLIEKYFARNIGKSDNVPDLILNFNQLINIAAKKYRVPDYQINRLTAICSAKRNELLK